MIYLHYTFRSVFYLTLHRIVLVMGVILQIIAQVLTSRAQKKRQLVILSPLILSFFLPYLITIVKKHKNNILKLVVRWPDLPSTPLNRRLQIIGLCFSVALLYKLLVSYYKYGYQKLRCMVLCWTAFLIVGSIGQ